MAIGSALSIAKAGVLSQQQFLNVLGHNIANVNTTGFKGSRIEFGSLLSQTNRGAVAPNGNQGGINPVERGLGARVSAIYRSHNQGAIDATTERTDLAVDGKGLFILGQLEGGAAPTSDSYLYTRDGSFEVGMVEEADGSLVQTLVHKSTGLPILGQQPDDNFILANPADGILTDALDKLEIPLGSSSSASATSTVRLSGNFNASGTTASQGSILTSNLSLANNGTVLSTSDISDVYDNAGNPMFNGLVAGETIGISLDIGGETITRDFIYGTDGTTVEDLGNYIETQYLNTDIVAEGAGVTFAGGQLQVAGNYGTRNALTNLEFTYDNSVYRQFSETQIANGESERITVEVVDSLGNLHPVDLTFVKESTTNNAGQSWRWYATSDEETGSRHVGTGTFTFDSNGQYTGQTDTTITLNIENGADSPLAFDVNFDTNTSNLASEVGSLPELVEQDGIQGGVMNDWVVNDDGAVLGLFSNGERRELGRVALGLFMNPSGMLNAGDSLYRASDNTGDLTLRIPQTGNAGLIRQFALEGSNVDLANALTSMIEAQRAFQANARTITTDDEIVQEAVGLVR